MAIEVEQPYVIHPVPTEVFSMIDYPDRYPRDLLLIGANYGRPIAYRESERFIHDLTIANFDPGTMHESPEIVILHFNLARLNEIQLLHFTSGYAPVVTQLQELRTRVLETGFLSTKHLEFTKLFMEEVSTRLVPPPLLIA